MKDPRVKKIGPHYQAHKGRVLRLVGRMENLRSILGADLLDAPSRRTHQGERVMTKEKLNRWISGFRSWLAWFLFRVAARITDASVHSCPDWTWKLTKCGIDRKHKFVSQKAGTGK